MGVEIGEGSLVEQGAIESIISEYSFHDASVGIVSLAASIYYFGVLGMNDVNVLTLLAVAIVAGLNQEVGKNVVQNGSFYRFPGYWIESTSIDL